MGAVVAALAAGAGVNTRAVADINLTGQVLGILGSLFFTYDLLGRPGGPLRWLLRVAAPTILGAVVAVVLVAPVAWWVFGATPGQSAGTLASFAYAGGLLGAYNGLFVDAPGTLRKRWPISLADGMAGAVLGAAAGLVATRVLPNWTNVALTTQNTLLFAGIAGLVGGVLASIWRFLNRDVHNVSVTAKQPPHVTEGIRDVNDTGKARQPRFSGRGCVLGSAAAAVFAGVVYGTVIAGGGAAAVLSVYTLPSIAIVMVTAGIVGGLSRPIFWWVNVLPNRGLEVIGVLLILLAFAAQAAQPVLVLLGVLPG